MLRPPAILCIGRNYAEHAAEMGGSALEQPMVFMKNPACVAGAEAEIVIPAICREHGPQVDFEGELAVEIGRECRDVPEGRALEVVGAYRVANDVSGTGCRCRRSACTEPRTTTPSDGWIPSWR